MTPTERALVADLFDRLAKLENTERDPQADRAIAEGLTRAPNAVYPLVQTVLLQNQALKDADARIRELEAAIGETPRESGFLDNMRNTVFGRREQPRGSVPSISAGLSPNAGAAPTPSERSSGYGSFLGTAAASAIGVIGGALMLDSIRSMMAGRHAGIYDQGTGASSGNSPWQGDAAGSDLSRQAGLEDIGRGNRQGIAETDDGSSFDLAENDFGDDFSFGGDD